MTLLSLLFLFVAFLFGFLVLLVVAASFLQKVNHGSQDTTQESPTKTRVSVGPSAGKLSERRRQLDQTPNPPSTHRSNPWFGFGEPITLGPYEIKDPCIFFGTKLEAQNSRYRTEPSLVNPRLRVKAHAPSDHEPEVLGYWPSYEALSPIGRGRYLAWLADGRNEPDIDIGYVFLFFYGLERRLLCDKPRGLVSPNEHALLIEEIERLLALYGKNRSFNGYAKRLLAFDWISSTIQLSIPPNVDIHDRGFSLLFDVKLAHLVLEQRPLPWRMALQWYRNHPDYALRTPARRCPDAFELLFRNRYQETFDQGMILKPNKSILPITYQPASSGISLVAFESKTPLPDYSKLKAPLKKIHPLVEACTTELEPYSRYLAKKTSSPDDLSALALLPSPLLVKHQRFTQIAGRFKQWFERNTQAGSTSIAELYRVLAEPLPEKLTKKSFDVLAGFLDRLGYGIAPDPRFHLIQAKPDETVVVFAGGHGQAFVPTYDFHMMVAILRLGAMVSQIDKTVSPTEEVLLAQTIADHEGLTQVEKRSLHAFLIWCLRTPQKAAGLKAGLATFSEVEKQAIGHILITVAQADGVIDPREIKQLEKLYTTLGLDKQQVTNDLHEMAAHREASREAPALMPAPIVRDQQPVPAHQPGGFQLNHELVRLRREETHQVKNVLQAIFADSSEAETLQPIAPPETTADSAQHDRLPAGLDPSHQQLFHQIIVQDAWSGEVFETHVKAFGLMRNGAVEQLNEWAFSLCDAPLLEDEGTKVYVDVDLVAEILAGQS